MTENYEVIKNEKKSNYFWLKLITILIVGISWIILIGLKLSSNISLRIPLIISGVLTVLGILAFIGQYYAKKHEEKKPDKLEIPKPLTTEEAKLKVEKAIEERWDHIKRPNGIKNVTTETIQGNQIYTFEVELLYGEPVYVIINATYPDTMPTIIKVSETKQPTKNKYVNAKSQNPKDDPDVIEETINDELSGRTKTIRKQIQKRKEEEKKEDETIA
jgi:hypothetical protein